MRIMAMNWIDLIGYIASASVLATFCMSTMVPLRSVAICSNILFATFGALAHVYPVLALHLVLFPVNCARLREAVIERRKRRSDAKSLLLLKASPPRRESAAAR